MRRLEVFNRTNQRGKWLALVFTGFLFLSLTSAAYAIQETYISDDVKESVEKRIANGESVGMVIGFIDARGKREYFTSGTTRVGGDKPVNDNQTNLRCFRNEEHGYHLHAKIKRKTGHGS